MNARTQGLLLVDHGSRLEDANRALAEIAELVRALRPELPVAIAHMSLAEPTIVAGLQELQQLGCNSVVVVPYMLTPGRHASEDIPRMAREAAEPLGLSFEIAPALGVHSKLAELVLTRSGL